MNLFDKKIRVDLLKPNAAPSLIRAGLSRAIGLGACLGVWLLWAAAAQAQPPDEFHQRVLAAVAKVQPALVTLSNSGGYSQTALIVDGSKGLVASTTQPLRGRDGQTYTVTLQGGLKYPARPLMLSRTTDLAIWRIEAPGTRFPEAPLADSRLLRIGESIIAIGATGGEARWGIISATNRDLAGLSGLIQTDAPITSHSSGEALLNLNGEVVGLITLFPNLSLPNTRGLGFAVPSSHMAEIRDSLQMEPTRPAPTTNKPPSSPPPPPPKKIEAYLGILVVDYVNFQSDRPPFVGCLIERVYGDGPGQRAGLRAGDIIVRLADKAIPNIAAYQRVLAASVVGGTVWLEIFRSGELLTLQMTVGGQEKE